MELENMFTGETFFLFFPTERKMEVRSIFESLKLTNAKVVFIRDLEQLESILHNDFSESNPKPDAIIYDENFTGFGPPTEMIERQIEPISVLFRSGHDPIVHSEHKKTLSLFIYNALCFIRYKVKGEVKV